MRRLVNIVVTLALAAATSTPMSSAAPIQSPPEPQGNAGAFNPPWNDDPASIQSWAAWCANERREGCYACENAGGAGKHCTAMCAEMGCPIRSDLIKIPAPPPAVAAPIDRGLTGLAPADAEPTRFSPLLDLSNLHTLQSTTRYGDAANAIDGDAGTHTATYFESEPWWRIELGKETVVHGVTVTRVPTPSDLGKGYSDYLNGLEITVGGKPCASVTTFGQADTKDIMCAAPVTGAVVQLKMPRVGKVGSRLWNFHKQTLSLREVKILGLPAGSSVCAVDGVLDAKDPIWGPIWGNTCATLTDGSAGWNSPGQGFHLGNGEVLDIRFSGRKEVSSIEIETGLGAADSKHMPRSFKVEYITEGGQLKLAKEYGPGLATAAFDVMTIATAGTSTNRIVPAGALAYAEIVNLGDFLSNPNAKVQWGPAPANAGGPKIGVTGLRITNTGGSIADQWLRLAQVSVL